MQQNSKEQNEINDCMDLPSKNQLKAEIKRVNNKKTHIKALKNIMCLFIIISALTVLVSVIFLPIIRIAGTSMTPAISDGNIVVAVRGDNFDTGDIVAFYYNNKLLAKRVIAQGGDWVDVAPDGTVYVNNAAIVEPYVSKKSRGECDVELPFQIPENQFFVMGDHRSVSVDSRSNIIGCVSREQIVGKIVFRIFPFSNIGIID